MGGSRIWLPLFLCLSLSASSSSAESLELKRLPSPSRDGAEPASTLSDPAAGRAAPTAAELEGLEVARQQIEGRRPFPHLLYSDAPVRAGALRGGARSAGLVPNAFYDPNSLLPPSVLSPQRQDAVLDLLGAGDTDALLQRLTEQKSQLGSAPPDTARICILRVDFLADRPGSRSSGDGRFDLRTETDPPVTFDPPPHNKAYFTKHMEALARYYDVQTNGRLVLEFDVWPSEENEAYHLPDTFRYGPWIFSNSNPDVLQHAIDLVGDSLVEADADAEINFSKYNHFLIFHAGPDFQGDVNRDSPWDIPSFNLFVVDPFVVQDSTVAINLVMVAPETVSQDAFAGAINGVVTHEFGHQLGFFDLYDVQVGAPVVGAFSLMDSGDNLFALIEDPLDPTRNLAIRGTLPASVDPWHKLLWFPDGVNLTFSDDEISETERSFETTLETVQLNNDIVQVPLNLNEYLLLENRHLDLNGDGTVIVRQDPETGVILGPEPDSTEAEGSLANLEYDWLIPGEGILAWHVDFLAINAGLNTPGGGINIFFSRPGVRLVEADGIRDIGTGSSEFLGGPLDPFFKGGYDLFSPITIPSTETNDGTRTGVEIAVLDSIGMEMRITVQSDMLPPGWPLRVGADPQPNQFLSLDLEGEGIPSLIFPGEDPSLGTVMLNLPRDGGRALLFAEMFGPLDAGMAGRNDFLGAERTPRPLLAVASGGRLQMLERDGSPLLTYPGLSVPASTASWSTPVLGEQTLWVGEGDALVRVSPTLLVESFDSGSGGRDVSGLAVLENGDEAEVFWAATGGRCGLSRHTTTGLAEVWSMDTALSSGVATTRSRAVLALEQGGQLDRFFVAWDDGTMEWRDRSGELIPGWPIQTGFEFVGEPIVSDFDLDGSLEVIAVDEQGNLHAWNEDGALEIDWPRSAWDEDDLPVIQRVGPRVLDVDGDGEGELVLLRGDGYLFAWEPDGAVTAGWPISFGTPGVHGPHPIPASDGYEPRLAVGTLEGVTADSITVESVSVIRTPDLITEGVGFFAFDGFDPARSRVVPAELQPVPQTAEAGVQDLKMYPNPVRGDFLSLHTILGSEAEVRVDAFDLAGNRVGTETWKGHNAAAGNVFQWDVSEFASGLYQVRVRVEGENIDFERFEQIAIVR